MKFLVATALACVLAFTAAGQDSTRTRSWSLNGYVKDMQTVIFGNIDKDWTFDNLIHNRLNFKWRISPAFTTGIEMRNRFAFGNMTTLYPGYYKSFEYDNGVMNLS